MFTELNVITWFLTDASDRCGVTFVTQGLEHELSYDNLAGSLSFRSVRSLQSVGLLLLMPQVMT